ncbi:GyrI-like domain-containing protein [Paenibacillus sp. VCA1]|uniref:GyrI-like domain-containing protein n=1 Tax=Paenibacillus sp. VCA1 TaxID=3039148 RepID=UPI002871F399|nr:effector binding domain-containing protein [Paenibacillus sp. VCA1]MDR9856190.1 GyrI-like domain-containing protein [Paenibacillus sp. VCA1]
MEAKKVRLPSFIVVGFRIEANLDELESGIGKNTYDSLISRKDEILLKKNENMIFMQIYPMKSGFNPRIDRFTQIFCYEVNEVDSVPSGMVSHQVAECNYVTYTHKGLESELGRSYDYLYGQWMREHGHEPIGYDFEVWDDRYKPESSDNEIDMYVALG